MKKNIALSFFLLFSLLIQGQEIQKFNSSGKPFKHNEKGCNKPYQTISTVNVDGVGNLENGTKLTQVDISITHDYIQGVHVVLVPPRIQGEEDGSGKIDLFVQEGKAQNKPNSKTSNISFKYRYGNESGNNISAINSNNSPPFNGDFFAYEDFRWNDSGRLADGKWEIRVCDFGAPYAGEPKDPKKPDGPKYENKSGRIGNVTLHFEVADLFSSFTHLKNLSTNAKTFLSAKNWDNGILTKLDEDLANTTLKNAIDAKPQLIDSWEIVKDGSEALRRNTANLEKLNDFISATGMEKSKLIISFGNTKSPQKWVDIKIPESNLDALYDGFKNSPPSKFDAWTPDHKAQRWANHKKGNPDADFNTWSNKYDGNIDKANFANNGVNDYFSTLTGNVVKEKSYTNISINTPDGVQSFTRRLDIVYEDVFKGIEFKEYSSGKVYRSPDIKREYTLDGKLLQDDLLDDIEWIFKGCKPSAPLRSDLEALGITVTLLP